MNRILVTAAIVGATSSAFAQLTENFDVVPMAGWNLVNLSAPVGTVANWFQGNDTVFPAQSGAPTSYMGANFNMVAGTGLINAWAMTPEITLQNGAIWSFWTRTVDAPAFPDRLHLKMSTNGGSTNVADFTTTLVSVNNGLTTTGYPSVWTEFSGSISGLGGPVQGRLAFHYDVPNGGPSGSNSDYIGIDTFDYNPVPEPGTIAVVALGLGALMLRRRKA